jgi:hypothetical protein
MELKRLNRRRCSLPFDWLITPDVKKVIELIENNFQDFLNPEYLYQFKQNPSFYKNIKYDIEFYHDFSAVKSFKSQIHKITKKYNRRIARFYDVIKEPTLFCRYVSGDDLSYISENYEYILMTLRRFNSQNEIIFVINNDLLPLQANFPIYGVEKDRGDKVSRVFLEKNQALKSFILNNVEEATPMKVKKRNKVIVFLGDMMKKIRWKFGRIYRHNRQI